MKISVEELALATAEQALMEANLDADGKLSFEEIKLWYAEAGLSAKCFDEAEADMEGESSEPEDVDTGPVTFYLVEFAG